MPNQTKSLPTLQEFSVALPLYTEYYVQDSERQALYSFASNRKNIDCFCVDCQQPSVFLGPEVKLDTDWHNILNQDRTFTREFFCSRVYSHALFFHYRIKAKTLSKIGQSPSMADISEAELLPYRKVLSTDEYRELTKAVGLASHGVGIGSFVYLRRIFERLIEEARAEANKIPSWDDEAFRQSRMDDKIELLTSYLPPFLVEQRKLYSILSKGIHSLTEQDCLDSFPIVRVGIELILDQKVALKQQQEKMEEAKKRIGDLQQRLKQT